VVWAWGRKANFGKKILEIVGEEQRVTTVAVFPDGLFGLVELGVSRLAPLLCYETAAYPE
jgi:hypothetical protein